MNTTWVFKRWLNSYEIGYYDPQGSWECYKVTGTPEEAEKSVHYLNGGCYNNNLATKEDIAEVVRLFSLHLKTFETALETIRLMIDKG